MEIIKFLELAKNNIKGLKEIKIEFNTEFTLLIKYNQKMENGSELQEYFQSQKEFDAYINKYANKLNAR